jgi:anti-sigma B factor antagonist
VAGPSIDLSVDSSGLVRLVVAGEIDMATSDALAGALRDAIATEHAKEVAVDLAGVTFIDSSGIRALVVAQDDATERGVAIYVTKPHAHVRRVLELTGLLAVLTEAAPPGDEERSPPAR